MDWREHGVNRRGTIAGGDRCAQIKNKRHLGFGAEEIGLKHEDIHIHIHKKFTPTPNRILFQQIACR